MKRIVLALTAVAGLFVSTTAAAPRQQDEWTTQVRRMLQQAGREYESRGYSMTHRIFTGSLGNGDSEMVSIPLDIGTAYQIMGACDTDCSDLDLVLYDPNGNQLDDDLELDDFPIVAANARRSGNYRVKVTMAHCSAEPCRYGLGVFGK
ncbi:hypothetical protein [Longimicrobium sp.]|uniref:hypothetical protein n=1 Tax=Longimicrobium sp. TaxID=2029185 RepID=UPI002C46BDB1|nr:hypothetical protein [Longimicrobium sp.]HSU17767.1 hypothetical protein [Longimicrobium sp.]